MPLGIDGLREALRQRRERARIYSTAEYWDGKARALSGSAISMWRNRHLNEHYDAEQFRFLARHLPDPRGLRALDIGCGTGRVARFLQSRGARVTAMDFSALALAEARRLGPPEIDYRERSVLELAVAEPFDIVVGVGVLTVACRTPAEAQATLARIHAAVKPGGHFASIEPLHAGFLRRVLQMGADDFAAALTGAGFEVTARDELHFWPARLPLALAEWPRPLTALGYGAGRLSMAAFGRALRMGDYKAFVARRRA